MQPIRKMDAFGPDDLIACYRRGVFPMSDHRDDDFFYLVEPKMRGILPLFAAVINACATHHGDTWISHAIEGLYSVLHMRGEAHSVEVWDGDQLVGGLYGVHQGRAFFGESMFSTQL